MLRGSSGNALSLGGVAIAPAAWTPVDASGASLTFTSVSASYTQLGNMIFASYCLTFPVTADATAAKIGGLPVAVPNKTYVKNAGAIDGNGQNVAGAFTRPVAASSTFTIIGGNGVAATNVSLSTLTLSGCVIYPAA